MTQGTTTPLLRAFSSAGGDHFYTTSTAERDSAVAKGYVSEGIACHVLPAADTHTTPLLRVFNPKSTDHLYTTSTTEHDNAVAELGYVSEGIACYVLAAAGANTTPLLRMFNPANTDHFYTTSTTEHDNAVAELGYVSEGIACHVYSQPIAATAYTTSGQKLDVEGTVIELLPNDMYKVDIGSGHDVTAVPSGRSVTNFTRIAVGDKVQVMLDPYDLSKGRIVT